MGTFINCGGRLRRRRRYDFKSAALWKVYGDEFVYGCAHCGLYQADVSNRRSRPAQILSNRIQGHRKDRDRRSGPSLVPRAGGRSRRISRRHRVGPAARAFEVGAGYGYNLRALKALYPDLLLFTDELDESIDLPDEIRRANLTDGPYDIVVLVLCSGAFLGSKAGDFRRSRPCQGVGSSSLKCRMMCRASFR